MSKSILSALVAVAALLAAPAAVEAATCADRVPAAIQAAAAGSEKCQDAIAKAGAKYVKTKLKELSKCKLKEPAATCPTVKADEKIQKAALKAADTIAKACGDDAAQGGLPSSYGGLTDDAVISSCMLSQHDVELELVSWTSNGASTEELPGTGKERAACVKELSKQGATLVDKALKNATKCLKKQKGAAGDLAPVCVGSFAGGSFVPPTDSKTGSKQQKLIDQTQAKIEKKCAKADALDQLEGIFACPSIQVGPPVGPGPAGVLPQPTEMEKLTDCMICTGMEAVFDLLEHQYAETGNFVANGPGAIQAAVDVAQAGDKLLIGSGDYVEEVTIPGGTLDGLAMVGCGAATDDRPVILPPDPEVTRRGILASDTDGLLFQSLDFFNQDDDHIRVSRANGVSFRDIHGDGNEETRYAVFPIESENVLVELCEVRAQDDAPIYVGQSAGIVVRYNDVREGVAAIEIENSGSAQVYGNITTDNTAGIFLFLDPTLLDLSECHEVHHNYADANNRPNFASGGAVTQVPAGTGMISLSTDDTVYAYNFTRNNDTAGMTFADQENGFGGEVPPPPYEPAFDRNWVYGNVMTGNGTQPDPSWPLPNGADFVAIGLSEDNCRANNTFVSDLTFGIFALECQLPVPEDAFQGCPVSLPPPAI